MARDRSSSPTSRACAPWPRSRRWSFRRGRHQDPRTGANTSPGVAAPVRRVRPGRAQRAAGAPLSPWWSFYPAGCGGMRAESALFFLAREAAVSDTGTVTADPTPGDVLRRIAYLLERAREPTYRVRAFRTAAQAVDAVTPEELAARVAAGTLTELRGIGKVTAEVVTEALAGEVPVYLRRLEATGGEPIAAGGERIRATLRGDLHTHSDWSDGGSPIHEMVAAASALGHEYMALTDHSPRLTVANGLSADRLRRQLEVVADINRESQI